MPHGDANGVVRIKVWDRSVRLFHWFVVLLVALAWWTAHHDQMGLHRVLGYTLAGLLAFRLWWGFFGSSTARFTAFVRGPQAVARYARGLFTHSSAPGEIGHNPMGGWSVLGLLSLLLAEVLLGLFSVDVDGEESGPLADRVSFDWGRVAAHWHQIVFNSLLALIALHVLAIAFYALVRRENLIGAMITGAARRLPGEPGLRPAAAWAFWVGAAIALVTAVLLARGLR